MWRRTYVYIWQGQPTEQRSSDSNRQDQITLWGLDLRLPVGETLRGNMHVWAYGRKLMVIEVERKYETYPNQVALI